MSDAATNAQLCALSRWIDDNNALKPAEQQLWERTAKTAEEAGEVIAAMIGYTGQNPRKGYTHSISDVQAELLDVAVTALGAIAHIHGNDVDVMALLHAKVHAVAVRAGLTL